MNLRTRFVDLISKYSSDQKYNLGCWNKVENSYTSESRHYHDLSHIENMFEQLDYVKNEIEDMDAVCFSIFYHDIIYKVARSDNELKSALILERDLAPISFDQVSKCKLQIEATKNHERSQFPDTNILLDLDLSILGADWEVYEEYTENVRKEFKIYPNFLYRKGRKKFLKTMLAKDQIFKTDYFTKRLEQQAIKNLKRELELLTTK